MEETSIVWSTESLFPDLHPTVVDTSHSRTLDASTCLRILLIPRSILFSFSLRARDSLLVLSFPEEARRLSTRSFHRRHEIYIRSLSADEQSVDANGLRSFSSWIFSPGLAVTVLLQNIFESRGKSGLSTWGNRRGLPGGPRRLHSTVALARSINHCETGHGERCYSKKIVLRRFFEIVKIVTGKRGIDSLREKRKIINIYK